MPPYDPEKAAAAAERLTAARRQRDTQLKEATERINTAFWKTVREILATSGLRPASQDVAQALDYTKQHIHQQLAQLAKLPPSRDDIAAAKERVRTRLWTAARAELDAGTLQVDDIAEVTGSTAEDVRAQLARLPAAPPAGEDRAAALARLTAAREHRDTELREATDQINAELWKTVRAELAAKNLRQADAAAALDFSTQYIRNQLASHPET